MSPDSTPDPSPTQPELTELGARLVHTLRLRTDILALQGFADEAEMSAAVPRLRRPTPGVRFSFCQLVGQARHLGWTLGVGAENVPPGSNCGGVVGIDTPAEKYLSGEMFEGIWFENREAARRHQAEMPRAPAGRWSAVALSPLAKGRLKAPHTLLIHATPGQMIFIINALQHRTYTRYQFGTTGETACADSWGAALLTEEPSLSIPCFAERRFGGVAEDELLIALPPRFLGEVVRGLDWLAGSGMRYPCAPFGVQCDPTAVFKTSYDGKYGENL